MRAEWQALLDGHPQLVVRALVDGEPLHERLAPLADSAVGSDDDLRRRIRDVMSPYVSIPAVTASAVVR